MKKINILSVILGLLSGSVFAQQSALVEQPTVQQAENTVPATSANNTQLVRQAINPNLVNINVASAAEIQDKLVGIGEKKAQAIVDYRTKNGAFSSIEQLKEVSGIGSATLDKNRERIVLQ